MNSLFFLLFFPGDDYLNQHRFEEAARYYRLFSSIAPSHEICYGSGIAAMASGDLENGIELLRPLSGRIGITDYYLGVTLYRKGLYREAAACFQRLPESWTVDYYLGLVKLKHHDIDQALDNLRRIPDPASWALLFEFIEDYNRLIGARKKFSQRQYEEAASLYEGIRHFPGYRVIGLALSLSRTGDARGPWLIDSFLQCDTDPELRGRALIEAGAIYLAANNMVKARQYLRDYLVSESDDYASFLLGRVFSRESQYDSAIFYFRNLPDSVDDYLFFKGRTEYFLGFWGKAEEQLLRHYEIFPYSSYRDRSIYILGSINYRRKEYDQAIVFWQELVDCYPKSSYAAAAQEGIGDAYFYTKQLPKALQAYRRVKGYAPTNETVEETSLKIYETLYHLGRYPTLVDALRGFIEKNPASRFVPKTRLRIAQILFDRNEYYQSLAELERIIEKYPTLLLTNEAYIERARIYQILGNEREIKNSFYPMLRNDNDKDYYSYALNELGMVYLKESKFDSALSYFNRLLDFDKYREKAMLEIARIYEALGQNNASETMIKKLIEEYPQSIFLFDAYILESHLYKNQGDYQNAIKVLNELVKELGPRPELYIEIGDIYFELEDFPAARANYLLASEYFKQKRDEAAKALILAGDASLAIGDKTRAQEYYLKANLIAKSLTLKNQATAKIADLSKD